MLGSGALCACSRSTINRIFQRAPAISLAKNSRNTAAFSEIEYGGHQQVGKYDGIFGSSWLLEASIARSTNRIAETPSVNEWSVRDRRVTPNTFSGGIGFYEVGNEGENLQYSVKSTNLFGAHQVRYGFTYEVSESTRRMMIDAGIA